MEDLRKYIVPSSFINTDDSQMMDTKCSTKDYVFLEAGTFISRGKSVQQDSLDQQPTDYAIMNGTYAKELNGKMLTKKMLRDARSDSFACYLDVTGSVQDLIVDDLEVCLFPVIHLDGSLIAQEKAKDDSKFKMYMVKPMFSNNDWKHIMEFGEYPQSLSVISDELEEYYKAGKLKATGKVYINYTHVGNRNVEYEYNGKKYVRVISNRSFDGQQFLDGSKVPPRGEPVWAVVEPIAWEITNWDMLNKDINPNGKGYSNEIELKSTKGLISQIPFNYIAMRTQAFLANQALFCMWQNSVARAFLNDYDLHAEIDNGNGNKKYKINNLNHNMQGRGFLYEAFNINTREATNMQDETAITNAYTVKKGTSRLTKLNPDTSLEQSRVTLTDTERIKMWIDNGQSVLLRGPSGIGKTERIRKLYPDLIYLQLSNNMFPEKVVGSDNLQTGLAIPPYYAKKALMLCATDEEKAFVEQNIQNIYKVSEEIYERSKNSDKKVVILLDELLNVKPAVQNLVFTLVLDKFVQIGQGLKLPANTVVVATGNQQKYSASAEELATPLEKRFDHILDMEPKVDEWLREYAIPNKLHPSVVGYIFTKFNSHFRSNALENIGYFYEEPEVGLNHLDKFGSRGKTNDPRGWASVSDTLYNFERNMQNGKFIGKDVRDILYWDLKTKLRQEWARDFYDFYTCPTLTVEDIVAGTYSRGDLPHNINEKFAVLANLLSATQEQVAACRDFVFNFCDPEYLAVYDLYWIGQSEERAMFVAELPKIKSRKILLPEDNTQYKLTIEQFFDYENVYSSGDVTGACLKCTNPAQKAIIDDYIERNKIEDYYCETYDDGTTMYYSDKKGERVLHDCFTFDDIYFGEQSIVNAKPKNGFIMTIDDFFQSSRGARILCANDLQNMIMEFVIKEKKITTYTVDIPAPKQKYYYNEASLTEDGYKTYKFNDIDFGKYIQMATSQTNLNQN